MVNQTNATSTLTAPSPPAPKRTLAPNGNELIVNPVSFSEVWVRYTRPGKKKSGAIFLLFNERWKACKFFLQLKRGALSNQSLKDLPDSIKNELIEVEILVPPGKYPGFRSLLNRFKSFTDLKLDYNGKQYVLNPTIGKVGLWVTGKQYQASLKESSLSLKYGQSVLELYREVPNPKVLNSFPTKISQKLIQRGLLIERKYATTPKGLFSCKLNEEMIELVANRFKQKMGSPADKASMRVNPHILLPENGKLSPEMLKAIPILESLGAELPNVWVKHPVTDIIAPLLLETSHYEVLKQLLNQQITVAELEPKLFDWFRLTELVIANTYEEDMKAEWAPKIAAAQKEVKEKECFNINDLFNPLQIAMLRRYVRLMADKKFLGHDNLFGTRERYWVVNEKACYLYQDQVTGFLNKVLPKPVKGATNYLTVYKPGSVLKAHIDVGLPMCNYALSMAIDMQPEVEEDNWPLYAIEDGVKHELPMIIGDAGVFRPGSLHGRENKLTAQAPSVVLFWFAPLEYKGFINGKYV